MAMDAVELANKLHDVLGQKKDGNGAPTPVSSMTLNRAKGVIAALKAAVGSNPPGTITGTTAPGSPLTAGAGTNGVLVMTPAPMKAITNVGLDAKAVPNMSKENDALITYFATAKIVFTSGGITGTCTNTPTAPGPLTAGAGSNGKLTGITGAGAMAVCAAALGANGPEMEKHYSTLVTYILDKAVVTYAPNSVTGVCPPGGGPLTLGAAAGATIA